jgi:hypothetical protein
MDNYNIPALKDSELIRIVESMNLLDSPSRSKTEFKRRLLKRLGYEYVFQNQNNTKIDVNSASADVIQDHLRAAYYCAKYENTLF